MDRKELFLKYIDDELSEDDRQRVEELLNSDKEAQEQMEDLKSSRETLLSALDRLNPIDSVPIPDFKRPGNLRFYQSLPFRMAAAVAVLIGMAFILWEITSNDIEKEEDTRLVDITEIEQKYEDLDYYISPNRCWNQRKIPLIIIKIN
jgi:hypothetical protein